MLKLSLLIIITLPILVMSQSSTAQPDGLIEKFLSSDPPQIINKLEACISASTSSWKKSEPILTDVQLSINIMAKKSLSECGCKKNVHEASFELRDSTGKIIDKKYWNVMPLKTDKTWIMNLPVGFIYQTKPPAELRICCSSYEPCK